MLKESNIIRIAHRGNTHGRKPSLENDPAYIQSALDAGYHVEVDVWQEENQYFLGHDGPRVKVGESFLENPHMICHAKNINALQSMLKNSNIHCFWHEEDKYTLTSMGWVWKYPEVYKDGILFGVCGDWV